MNWKEDVAPYLSGEIEVPRKDTGLVDKNGAKIHTGDIVEFYFDADYGHGDKDSGYTRMRDLVLELEDQYYFICGIGGSFAEKHLEHCEVIGTDVSLIDS